VLLDQARGEPGAGGAGGHRCGGPVLLVAGEDVHPRRPHFGAGSNSTSGHMLAVGGDPTLAHHVDPSLNRPAPAGPGRRRHPACLADTRTGPGAPQAVGRPAGSADVPAGHPRRQPLPALHRRRREHQAAQAAQDRVTAGARCRPCGSGIGLDLNRSVNQCRSTRCAGCRTAVRWGSRRRCRAC